MLFLALARGDTLADAAYYALPVLSWQSILIGDPLYRPFSVPLRKQLLDLDRLPVGLASYPVLRLMRLLESEKRAGDALAVARSALREQPGMLAVRVALAERLRDAGKAREAAAVLAPAAAKPGHLAPDQWALACAAARLLIAVGDAPEAGELYRRLLAVGALPPELRGRWLVDARGTAVAAKNQKQADAWQAELKALRVNPPAAQ